MTRIAICRALIAALLLLVGAPAPLVHAQSKRGGKAGKTSQASGSAASTRAAAPSADPNAAPPPKVKVERTASGAKIFRITEGIVVEGRIQKPNAFYVLQRSSIDYDWESLKQDFLPRILDATGKNPF